MMRMMRMKTKGYKDSRRVKRCRECGVKESEDEILTVHHVFAKGQGGADSEENYILLCRDCHDDIESGDTESGFKRII
jgi:5-methylcytosine-specific restriction endonuclease McrA